MSQAVPLMALEGLSKFFKVGAGFMGVQRQVVHAVDGVDLAVEPHEVLGLVGGKRLRQIHPGPFGPGPAQTHHRPGAVRGPRRDHPGPGRVESPAPPDAGDFPGSGHIP